MTNIEWINKDETQSSVLSHPGIAGWVAVRNDGTQCVASDKESEDLGDILVYFNEMTRVIGGAFDLGSPDEAHIISDENTAICLTSEKETVCIILDNETRPEDFLAKFHPE